MDRGQLLLRGCRGIARRRVATHPVEQIGDGSGAIDRDFVPEAFPVFIDTHVAVIVVQYVHQLAHCG